MKKFLLAALAVLAIAACGGADERREEIARFRVLCAEADGVVLVIPDMERRWEWYECFTGLERVELEGWEIER